MRNTKPKTIYAIQCQENGRIYIGCCTDFESRVRTHFLELQNGNKFRFVGPSNNRTRQDTLWQQDYNQYGVSAFDVYVLEKDVPPDLADDKEREYILLYRSNDPDYGYNVRPLRRRFDFVVTPGRPPIPEKVG